MNKSGLILLIIASACLFSIATYKAITIDLTVDEAATWLDYAPKPWEAILLNDPTSLNNHILNTVLVKISCWAFGFGDCLLQANIWLPKSRYDKLSKAYQI